MIVPGTRIGGVNSRRVKLAVCAAIDLLTSCDPNIKKKLIIIIEIDLFFFVLLNDITVVVERDHSINHLIYRMYFIIFPSYL